MHVIKEEIKLSPYVNNMIVYVRNPKKSKNKAKPKMLLELISDFSKVADCKINAHTQKNVFLCTNSEHIDTEIKNTMPFTIT